MCIDIETFEALEEVLYDEEHEREGRERREQIENQMMEVRRNEWASAQSYIVSHR